jgi:hypothetical protein
MCVVIFLLQCAHTITIIFTWLHMVIYQRTIPTYHSLSRCRTLYRSRLIRTVPDTASYIRGWMQMVLTPNDLFSWNNKYSKYTSYYCDYIHKYNPLFAFQLCTSLTLCMLAFWSCEGVVFLVHSSSSHLTAGHVFPFPLSGANWRSLSLLWGSGPPLPKMAPSSTGSAHTPFLGSNTRTMTHDSLGCSTLNGLLAACVLTVGFLWRGWRC